MKFKLALVLPLLLVAASGCSTLIGRPFKVEGAAMEPTLKPGTTVWARERDVYGRGDIVIFRDPKNPSRVLLKRIVGLPAETLEIKQGVVFINGEPLNEPYVNEPADYTTERVTIPADEYYVMGDNRNNSTDSRGLGTVPRSSIIGAVTP